MQAGTAKSIAKGDIGGWLRRLIERAEVIGPVRGAGGDVVYSNVTSPDQVLWQFTNSLQPPKHVVMPQTDPIVTIRRGTDGHTLEAIFDVRKRILFNLRNCDARGIAFLAKMYRMDLPDAPFIKRVESTTLITLSCPGPCPEGFCVCTESGPFLREGYDIQLTDLGERVLAEPGSDVGRALLDDFADLFRPASESEVSHRTAYEEQARGRFGEHKSHFASAMRRISTARVAESLWEEASNWCLECGGCNMACPTCYCFSVKDLRQDGGWVRCRIWDSCQYPAFTLEASGHNPREHRKDRIKRRFFHKVSAQYFVRDGMLGCVGCGRCIKVCLGATHMPAVVAAIRRGAWHG